MSSINQSIQTNSLNEISLIKESINIYQRKSGVLALCSEQNQWTQTLSPKQLLGPHAQSHDYLIGLIAYGVYLKDWKNLHGVEHLNALQLKEIGIDPSLLRDKSTGFEANICRFNDLYIISFAGSDELVDFYADLRQRAGLL